MNILIVSVDFPPHTDGVSTVAHELATRLTESGKEIIVIGPRSKGDGEYDAQQKFRVMRTSWYEYGYFRFIPIFFLMPGVIIRYRIKKVIAMNIAYGGIIAYLFFQILGFNYILWAYGFEFAKFQNNPFMRRLYLKIYHRALFVAAITNFVKERLIKFGVQPQKIVIVKPGTDPAKYRPLEVGDNFIQRHGFSNKRIIVSVGRLIQRKGFDMVIKAMPRVRKKFPDARYVIVGEGPLRQSLQSLSFKCAVQDIVHFMGRISDADLLNLYNLCDLLIMPSRTLGNKGDIEGFGIVFLEAGACEKPVIAGLDGGMCEAVENGTTGLLVNPLDVEEIAGAIIKILSDTNYAILLGINARKRVIEELNWERAIREFQLYMRQFPESRIVSSLLKNAPPDNDRDSA